MVGCSLFLMLSHPSPDLPGALSIWPWLWELLHCFFHQSPLISSTSQQRTAFWLQSLCFLSPCAAGIWPILTNHCPTVSARSLSIDLALPPNSNCRCCCPHQRQSLTGWPHCMCRCTFEQHRKVSKPGISDVGNSVHSEILLRVCKWRQTLPTINLSSFLIIG